MSNEKKFFDDILKLEKVAISMPLSRIEIIKLYERVDRTQAVPLFEFVKLIEQAHGIGVNHG